MSGSQFGRAVVVSFIATFIAAIYGYWEVALGLPRIDFALLLGMRLTPEGVSREFAYAFGILQLFIDGAILGLFFVRVMRGILPGGDVVKGLSYGIIVWVGSSLIVSPLFGAGLFWVRWGVATLSGVFIWHLIWGLTLGIAYRLSLPKGG